jgi:hypothetical protein
VYALSLGLARASFVSVLELIRASLSRPDADAAPKPDHPDITPDELATLDGKSRFVDT